MTQEAGRSKSKKVRTKKKTKKATKTKQNQDFEFQNKWGKEISDYGHAQIPSILIEKQHALGINCTQMVILINLMKFWWKGGSNPFPSVKTIADSIGLKRNTVQKAMVGLVDDNILRKINRFHENKGQTSNEYDLEGLKLILEDYCKQARELKDRHEKETKEQKLSRRRNI